MPTTDEEKRDLISQTVIRIIDKEKFISKELRNIFKKHPFLEEFNINLDELEDRIVNYIITFLDKEEDILLQGGSLGYDTYGIDGDKLTNEILDSGVADKILNQVYQELNPIVKHLSDSVIKRIDRIYFKKVHNKNI